MGGDLNEVVDIRSGLAYLLVKWKIIVAAMIAGALIGALLSGRIGARTTGSYEDSLRNARAACSEEGAQYAEQLSAQYKAYNNELRRWGDYLNNAALLRIDPNNYVKKDIQYQLVSDSGDMAETFSGALLSAGDQQAIGEILGIDPLVASVGELVVISGGGADTGIASESGEETALTEGTSVSVGPGRMLQMRKVDEVTARGDSGWLLNRQQSALDRLVLFQINYSLFAKNTTDILQGVQRTYYNLLISQNPEKAEADSVKKNVAGTAVKYAAAGGAAGLVIAVLCACLLFMFSGRIRTAEELFNNYALPVLQKFRIGEVPEWDVIKKCGFSCMGMDRAAQITESGAAPLYAELEKRMSGMENRQVYLTCDCTQEKVRKSVAALAEILTDEKITVVAGDPRDSEKDRKELLGSGLVVMAEVLGGSDKKDFLDLLAICRRNELPVLGCVTLLDISRY